MRGIALITAGLLGLVAQARCSSSPGYIYPALKSACRLGQAEVARSILALYPGPFGPRSTLLLQEAVKGGRIDVVQVLLADRRFDPSDSGNKLVLRALSLGDDAMLQLLLDDGHVDPHRPRGDVLFAALSGSDDGILEMVRLHPKVSLGPRSAKWLRYFAKKGAIYRLYRLLDDPDANPAADEYSALIEAARAGHTEVLQILLSARQIDPKHPLVQIALRNYLNLRQEDFQTFDPAISFVLACKLDQLDSLEALGEPSTLEHRLAIRIAITHGYPDMLRYYIEGAGTDELIQQAKYAASRGINFAIEIISAKAGKAKARILSHALAFACKFKRISTVHFIVGICSAESDQIIPHLDRSINQMELIEAALGAGKRYKDSELILSLISRHIISPSLTPSMDDLPAIIEKLKQAGLVHISACYAVVLRIGCS